VLLALLAVTETKSFADVYALEMENSAGALPHSPHEFLNPGREAITLSCQRVTGYRDTFVV